MRLGAGRCEGLPRNTAVRIPPEPPGSAVGSTDWIGLDWIGLDWIALDWIALDWIVLRRPVELERLIGA
jgi:hypothetical protein